MTDSTQKTGSWVILGATSGMARSFARKAATAGCPILLAGRNTEEMETLATDLRLRGSPEVHVVRYDAREQNSRPALVEAIKTLPQPLNVYLAFGIMPEQEDMVKDATLCNGMIETNYTGAVLLLNDLTPLFESQKSGSLIILGSVAGDRGRKKNYLYGSTKAGLHAFTQGLAAHLSDFGVAVLLVKPGVMDTAMTWGKKNPPLPLGQPDALAEVCWNKAVKRKSGTLYFPWFWLWIMLIIKHLPRFIFNRLNF